MLPRWVKEISVHLSASKKKGLQFVLMYFLKCPVFKLVLKWNIWFSIIFFKLIKLLRFISGVLKFAFCPEISEINLLLLKCYTGHSKENNKFQNKKLASCGSDRANRSAILRPLKSATKSINWPPLGMIAPTHSLKTNYWWT